MTNLTEVQGEIMAGNRLFGWNYGLFYSAGQGLVAKVFKSECTSHNEARKEFDNLARIRDMKDQRLNVPEPIDLVNLGSGNGLKKALCGNWIFDRRYEIYAVVMPFIKGPQLLSWERELWERYRSSTKIMVEAMAEHWIFKYDLKPLEVIGEDVSNRVFFVDTHGILFYDNPDEVERTSITESCRILFGHDKWSSE